MSRAKHSGPNLGFRVCEENLATGRRRQTTSFRELRCLHPPLSLPRVSIETRGRLLGSGCWRQRFSPKNSEQRVSQHLRSVQLMWRVRWGCYVEVTHPVMHPVECRSGFITRPNQTFGSHPPLRNLTFEVAIIPRRSRRNWMGTRDWRRTFFPAETGWRLSESIEVVGRGEQRTQNSSVRIF